MRRMTVVNELHNLENVQSRCVCFSQFLEKNYSRKYDDLIQKLACVVGSIEDVLTFDE